MLVMMILTDCLRGWKKIKTKQKEKEKNRNNLPQVQELPSFISILSQTTAAVKINVNGYPSLIVWAEIPKSFTFKQFLVIGKLTRVCFVCVHSTDYLVQLSLASKTSELEKWVSFIGALRTGFFKLLLCWRYAWPTFATTSMILLIISAKFKLFFVLWY